MHSKAPHHIEIAVEENSLKENERILLDNLLLCYNARHNHFYIEVWLS